MIKNITFVTSYFAPAWSYGGPPRVLYILAKELVKQRKTVNAITTDALDKKRNEILRENLDGVEVCRFKTISNALAYRLKIFIAPQVLENVKKILDQSDVVLFSDVRQFINWQIYGYLVKKEIPYGIFAFGTIPYGIGFKVIIKKIFDKWWVKDFMQKASFRFAQTKHEQEMYHEFFNIPSSETQLLSLPVEKEKYKIDKKGLWKFGKRWNIKDNDKVLLFVGRLHYLKGVDILIKAVMPLLEKDKHLKLLIVGRDDGEKSNLQKMVPPILDRQIIFTGPLYGEEVLIAYKTATCFIFTPRHYEETSLACLEALNCGIPVIVTQEADIPYLDNYKAGLVVKNEVGIIRKSILEILKKINKDGEKIQKQAKKLIQDHYLAKTVVDQLLSFLEAK